MTLSRGSLDVPKNRGERRELEKSQRIKKKGEKNSKPLKKALHSPASNPVTSPSSGRQTPGGKRVLEEKTSRLKSRWPHKRTKKMRANYKK